MSICRKLTELNINLHCFEFSVDSSSTTFSKKEKKKDENEIVDHSRMVDANLGRFNRNWFVSIFIVRFGSVAFVLLIFFFRVRLALIF